MLAKVKGTILAKYPYAMADLWEENPYTNFGAETDVTVLFPHTEAATIDGYELTPIIAADAPSIDEQLQRRVVHGPDLVNGVWTIWYSVENLTEAEKENMRQMEAAQVRVFRNKRLADCDWTQLADSPVDDLAWAKYRQELRDIPKQAGFPFSVVWPKEP